MLALSKNNGFTLLETIIYIGLFSLIFTGIFSSIYPILTGAQRLTNSLLMESEKEFILTKITYLINDSLSENTAQIIKPTPNSTSSQLIIENSGLEKYQLEIGQTNCQIPQICINRQILLAKDGNIPLPLNNNRLDITELTIYRSPVQTAGLPNFLEITFKINGQTIKPTRFYLHF